MESQNENWVVRYESVWSFLFLFSFNIFYYLTSEPLCLWKRKGKVITRQWQLQLGAGNGASSFQLCWLKFNKRQYEMICKSVTFFFLISKKKIKDFERAIQSLLYHYSHTWIIASCSISLVSRLAEPPMFCASTPKQYSILYHTWSTPF